MQNKKNIKPEPFHERRVLNLRQARLEELVSDLSKTRDNLGGQIRILTKAMESTADGIFIVNVQKPDFPVTYANRSFLGMTGYEKSEIIGRNYFLLYGPDADPHIVEEIKLRIHQGISFHGGMLIFKKNGEKCWNLLHITPVRDSAGVVTHYVGIQTDVTATRKRDMELREQREELLHVTRVGKLAEFVSSLAHEISQPLTAILSYSQAAQRILADREPQISEIFQYIINDDHRATEVIRRLRSLLKKTMPEIKPLDINSIIDDTIGLIAADITIRNILLKTELGNNLPPVHGDRVQLQQVLLNLVSNSLDAMENTQNSNEILISTSYKDDEMIVVLVKDSGCGIPSQNINKIFSHFFTSKPDGLGMGLSISRSIVESHGGQLNVENNPDKGATFSFTLPAGVKGEL